MSQELNAIPVVGWCELPLKDLGRLIGGGTPSRSQPSYWNGRIPWASVKDFSDNLVFLTDTAEHISHEGLASSASTLVPENTPVICTRMAVGRCALTTRPTAINQDLKALLFTKDVDRRFFIRLLRYHGPTLDRVSVGSTVRGITLGDLLSLKLSYPEAKQEQSRIAAVLDTIDEAIAKTEAVIAKLKQVRAGLLHDLLTRGLDENGQLRDPIAHPEQFQDSPIGRIPKEWDVLPLGSIASVDRGKFAHRPRNDPAFYGGRFPFIQTGDIALAAGEIITEASQSLNNRGVSVSREFSEGTIAVTIAANIGDTAILGRPMFFPDSIVGVVPIPMHINRWIELTLRDAKKRLNALAPQSAQKNINLEFLRPLLVPVPSSGEQKLCVQVYENITASISTEHHVLVKLSFLKSALMADLLTGRVRVPADIFQEHS